MNVPTSARVRGFSRAGPWSVEARARKGRGRADFTRAPPLVTRVNQQFRRAGMSGASLDASADRSGRARGKRRRKSGTHPRPYPEVLRRSRLCLPCRRGRRNRGHPGILGPRTHARRPRILCPREVSWSCRRAGRGSCVSLFGERERVAKFPGRREACERARRCARRTPGEGKRTTDVFARKRADSTLGLLVSAKRAPPGDFSQARTRSRLTRHAHRSPRGRAARGDFPPRIVPARAPALRSNSTGRTHASKRPRRRARFARSAKGPKQTQPWCVHGRRARAPQLQARDAPRAIATHRVVTNARVSSKRAPRSNVTRTRAFSPAPARST